MQTIHNVYGLTAQIADSNGDQIRKIVLDWLKTKTGLNYGDDLVRGKSFAFESDEFDLEVIGANLPNNAKFWMLQYSHPCTQVLTRRWYTEVGFNTNHNDEVSLIAIKLYVKDQTGIFINIPRSAPNLVKLIAQDLRMIVDGEEIKCGEDELNIRPDSE